MTHLVREFVDVSDFASLDAAIAALQAVRAALPEGAEADIRLKGDDLFGRRLTVSYLRPQTPEELALETRYAHAYHQSRERQLAEIAAELKDSAPVSLAA